MQSLFRKYEEKPPAFPHGTISPFLKHRILTHSRIVQNADIHGPPRIGHGTPVLVHHHGNDVSLDDPGAKKNQIRITA